MNPNPPSKYQITPRPRTPFSGRKVWLYAVSALLMVSGKANALVSYGYNCASCHSTTTGVVSLSGNTTAPTSLSVNPRLDAGSTASLQCFTAKPGDTVKVTLNSVPIGPSGGKYAFAITGNKSTESLVSGAVSGIKTSTANKLSFTGPSGWTTQNVNGINYFTQGSYSWASGTQTTTFQITIGNSTPADVYTLTYRSTGFDSNGNKWTQAQEFLVNVVSTSPVVTTGSASAIASDSATLNGSVNPNGLASSAYFQYGTTTSYGTVTGTQSLGSGSTVSAVSAAITGLSPQTTYHYRLVAVSTSGTTNGSDQTFTTSAVPPAVSTGAASAITFNGATLSGTVNPNGTATTVYFNYGTTTSYGSSTANQSAGSGTIASAISAALTGLNPLTIYHYQVVAVTASGTTLGGDQTFSTLAGPAAVVTGSASSITSQGSTLNGTVNPGGQATNAYFQYGLTTSYGSTTQTQSAGSGNTAGALTAAISGLTASTTYHFSLVAVNASGTTQGADQTFTTLPPAPVVITGTASAVTQQSATLNGTANPNGLTGKVYFNYGTTASYGSSTSQQNVSGSIDVPFSVPLPILNAATTYHYQIVAITASGTTFGADQSFTTLNAAPVAVTSAASGISDKAATLNGTVNPNGLSTTVYFRYGTTTGYGSTTSGQDAGSGGSVVAVHTAISGLTASSTYHYQLVAVSSSGTTFGSDMTFSATASGNTDLTALTMGGWQQLNPLFSVGYSTSVANSVTKTTVTPTAADPAAKIGVRINGAATFATVASGKPSGPLALNVGSNLVEVKVTAANGGSQIYSLTVTRVPLPVTGSAPVNLTTAILGGSVDGHSTTYAFQYGTTKAYGSTTPAQAISSGTSSVLVSATVSGLVPAVTYHYRIVATTGTVSDYGKDSTFVTARSYAAPEAATLGDAAPGIAQPATFLSFGNPIINDGNPVNPSDTDHWAFQAIVTGSNITKLNNSGIWVYAGSNNSLIARTGSAAQGGGIFTKLGDPVFNSKDQVAFMATVSGTGFTAKNNTGIWANTSGTLQRIAQAMGQPLDNSGVQAASFAQIVLPDQGGVIFLANLANGVGGVTKANNQGIWAESNGQLTKLIRKGDVVAGGTISTLSIFTAPVGVAGQSRNFNATGEVSFKTILTNGSQANFILTSGSVLTQLASSGSAAPTIFGAPSKYVLLGNPILNNVGNTAFQATLSGTTKGAVSYPAILAETGTANPLAIVALSGTYAPDANGVTGNAGVFAALGDPVTNSKDQIAFIGKLKVNGTVTGANCQGIWANTSGTLALVARAQDQAPGCATGAKFSLFNQLVLPDQGGVVFLATLTGKVVNASNNQGIWAVDTNGTLQLVARKGDVLMINGVPKIVSSLSVFATSTGVTGQTRSFNHAGDLIYTVTFTDKTQAIRKVVFP